MFDQFFPFRFIMTEAVEGEIYHHISKYTFDGPRNHQYIVLAENYFQDVYAIKFHLKSHSGSINKYTLMTGYHQVPLIIRTCIQIMLSILLENPKASFCVLGTEQENEPKKETKRFRIY